MAAFFVEDVSSEQMKGLWQTDYCTSIPDLSIIPSPSVVMALISFQINLKSSNRSVINLSKVSAFWVLQTLIIPRARVIKVGSSKEHVHCEVISQVSLVPLVHLSKVKVNRPPASYSFLWSTTVSSFATSQNSFTFARMVVWEVWATLNELIFFPAHTFQKPYSPKFFTLPT